MPSFQRMKEDLDDLSSQVSAKLPGRTVVWVFLAVLLLVIFVLGFGIGYGAKPSPSGDEILVSYFMVNNSETCPALVGERLLTTVEESQSFEGLVVNLQCKGNYNPFPMQVKCIRKTTFDNSYILQWSHLPVCYPSILVTPQHWSKTPHARSVSCSGNSQQTTCRLQCIQNYVAVEEEQYSCDMMPCRLWRPDDKKCYICDTMCDEFNDLPSPSPGALLKKLTCDPDCDKMIVSSDGPAAVWQNKRTGIFNFLGEHNGKPAYQNNATKEYLYYTFTGAEWLVGPDFRKPHAGIQVFQNDDTKCPERHGGSNMTQLYIDSSEPSPGGSGMWKNDTSISFTCYKPSFTTVPQCSCTKYKVYHTTYLNGTAPGPVTYLTGNFTKVLDADAKYGVLPPLYKDLEKDLMLFSHHPQGKVWQISTKFTTTPMRGVFKKLPACPDSEDNVWEWYNMTTPLGQQLYVPDPHIHVKCIAHGLTG